MRSNFLQIVFGVSSRLGATEVQFLNRSQVLSILDLSMRFG
jgi:hypothetical protein